MSSSFARSSVSCSVLLLVLGAAPSCNRVTTPATGPAQQSAPSPGVREDDRSPPPPQGKLVDVGGYRLHLHVSGVEKPAVVLIAGAGDFSFDWSLVQPGVSRFAQVCSYDRAGFAWSDLGPTPRTMRQEAAELHLLLKNAGVGPPYVLVGHSLGGLIARVYAREHPETVAGMVLVDATHEDTTLMYQGKLVRVRTTANERPIPPVQTLESGPPKPPAAADLEQAMMNEKLFGPPKTEPPFDKLPEDIQQTRLWFRSNPKVAAATDDFWAEELQAMHTARAAEKFPMGERPLVVIISAEKRPGPPPQGVSATEWERLHEEKREQKIGLTELSHNSKLVVAGTSGHHIQLDAPEVVIDSIRQVVEAVRQSTKLVASGPKRD